MKPVASVSRRARSDLYDQRDYIARENSKAALRFQRAAQAAFKFLAEMPTLGALCEFDRPAPQNMRMWLVPGFENHVIFYRPTATGIEVLRVLHAARDMEALFKA